VSTSDQWSRRQISLTRQYAASEIDSDDYGRDFMEAHNARARARVLADEATEALLDDLLYAVANNSDEPDREWPDQLDDEELRITVARYLADWDNGKYAAGLD
jgi:hypothetical protein